MGEAPHTGSRESALLAGTRVVDLTDDHGALAGRMLAELGASVVRVEAPGGGRGRGRAPRTAAGTSLHHLTRNAGKTIVEHDPGEPGAAAAVDSLLRDADVAFAGDGWGAADGAFAPAALAARHPHLITVAVTPFGLHGPAAPWHATELVTQAMAGVVFRAGVPERAPVAAPGSYCEDIGAVTAALAALVALVGRRGTAEGELVDVSTVMALAQCTDTALPLWSMLGADQTRQGAGLYPLFACTDGLARLVLPMTPGDWRSLIAWMGAPPEWTGPEWEKSILGPAERGEVMAKLPAMFADRTRDEVTMSAEAAGVRVTPVLTPPEVLGNEHVVARGTFAPIEVDGAPGRLFAGWISVDGARAEVPRPSLEVAVPARAASVEPAGSAATGLPLAGVRVLELGSGVASPEAGRVLAEWGAEVIKVEHRARPDFQRRVFGTDMNPAFASPNRSKRLLGANLAHAEGRAVVERLLPTVDLVLENNATGVLDRLGLGWDVLRRANPGIVLVSTQLYGDRGPWAARKGYGPSARAIGGLTWLWAHDDDAPRGVQTIHPDHFAGRLGALAGLAGLLARRRHGRGCRVDIAQFEAVMGLLGDLWLAESLRAGSARPVGNRDADHAPWDLYRCADDGALETWLALTVTDDAMWRALVEVAGAALAPDPAWAHEAGRLADRSRLDEAVAAWVRTEDPRALEQRLQDAGVAAAQALHPRVQIVHPQFEAWQWAQRIEQPGCGPLVFEGPAFTGARMGRPRCGPAPLPGADTRAICRELGLDDASIDRLVQAGALDDGTSVGS